MIQFFIQAFEDDSLSDIICDKVLYVTIESSCYSFVAVNGKVKITCETHMYSSHEEADTKMIAHIASVKSPATVVIRTSDTDVLAIAIGNAAKIAAVKIYLEVGIQSKNT